MFRISLPLVLEFQQEYFGDDEKSQLHFYINLATGLLNIGLDIILINQFSVWSSSYNTNNYNNNINTV